MAVKRRRLVAGLILATALALVIAGCGSSSTTSSPSGSTGAAASTGSSSGSTGSGATGSGSTGSGSTGSGSTTASGSPVKILAIVDTTGPTKAYGSQELTGIQAAAAYYNANGGINGHKVEVKAVSDNGDPATAASVTVQNLSSDPSQYAMVYPGEEGTTVAALIPVMKRFDVYSVALDDPGNVCASASACPNEFANLGSGSVAEVTAGDWFKAKGYKKVGILQEESAYTQTETPAIKASLSKNGIAPTLASFPSDAVDVSSEMSQLKSAGVQAIFAEAVGASAGYVLKARAALDWNVPVVFDLAGSALDLTTLVPSADVKNAYTTVCPCQDPAKSSPGFVQLKKYAPAGAIGALPANLAGDGWDAVVLFANAMKQAGSTSASALTKATETLSSGGQSDPLYIVTAKKRFSSSSHQNLDELPSDYSILAAGPVKGGQTQPLK